MTAHADVLIIGGGVIGLTTAYFLAREGARVTVVERGEPGQEASWAGAGILPPGNPAKAKTPFDRLRAQSCAMFPGLSAELRERTGIDNGYLRCGGLEFGDGLDAAENEWRGEGIAFEALDEAAAHALEPELGPGLGPAAHLPELAQLRNPRHLKALVAAGKLCGVRLVLGSTVQDLDRHRGRIDAVRTADGRLSADKYLIAAGAWSELLLKEVGWTPGIQPIRGQIVLLNPRVPLCRRVLMRGACYVVPRPDGRVLIGSTEEAVGFHKQTTARAIQSLLAFGTSLVPALGDARLEQAWSGLRPGSPDGLPFLGIVPGYENLYIAAGHFRSGIQLSPATGLVMSELLLGKPPTIALDRFRLDRYSQTDEQRVPVVNSIR